MALDGMIENSFKLKEAVSKVVIANKVKQSG